MAVDHYENFPVASLLLPAHLRPAVQAIYAFARSADDIADEGDAPPQARLRGLDAYEQELDRIERGGTPCSPVFITLQKTIAAYRLPIAPFRQLLSAFRQDVATHRYPTFDTLMDYSTRSAAPVGTLLLHLYGAADARNLRESNAICAALQLINFWQDVGIDWQKGRVYIPQHDLARFGVTEDQLAQARVDDAWRALMSFQIRRARMRMRSRPPLALPVPGRLGGAYRVLPAVFGTSIQ